MKNILTFLFVVNIGLLQGQRVSFQGSGIDSFIIQSHWAAYQFDDDGTNVAQEHEYVVIFDEDTEQYLVSNHKEIQVESSFENGMVELMEKNIKRSENNLVPRKKIESLVINLNTNKETEDYFNQLDTLQLKKWLSKRKIRQKAKERGEAWYLQRRYTTRLRKNRFYKSCQSIDSFKRYLTERFQKAGYTVVTDYSNAIDIWIVTATGKYRFEGAYPNPVKQPWYQYIKNGSGIPELVLNLEINESLHAILPKGFIHRKEMSVEGLFRDYLSWYFEKRNLW